jgi:hypothetical protein
MARPKVRIDAARPRGTAHQLRRRPKFPQIERNVSLQMLAPIVPGSTLMGPYSYSWECLEDESEGLTDQAIELLQHYAPALRRRARPREVLRGQNPTRCGAGSQGIAGTRACSCLFASHALSESGSAGGSAVNIRVRSAICGLAQLAAPVVLGGPSSTVGTYSNSWSPPSKVRLSTRSSLMSGYPS